MARKKSEEFAETISEEQINSMVGEKPEPAEPQKDEALKSRLLDMFSGPIPPTVMQMLAALRDMQIEETDDPKIRVKRRVRAAIMKPTIDDLIGIMVIHTVQCSGEKQESIETRISRSAADRLRKILRTSDPQELCLVNEVLEQLMVGVEMLALLIEYLVDRQKQNALTPLDIHVKELIWELFNIISNPLPPIEEFGR